MQAAPTPVTPEHIGIDALLAPVPGWLGRPLAASDGLPPERVDAAVACLAEHGLVVPPLLRDLHVRVGNCAPLMRHFQRFVRPEAWALAVPSDIGSEQAGGADAAKSLVGEVGQVDKVGQVGQMGQVGQLGEGGGQPHPPMMAFLDENQGVCQWLTDAQSQVYQRVNGALHAEPLPLPQFLAVVLPYQLAQGGWPCSAHLVLPNTALADARTAILAELGWPLLVQHNGLTIHGAGSNMLWSLSAMPGEDRAQLFVSSLAQHDLDAWCERFGFVDLG